MTKGFLIEKIRRYLASGYPTISDKVGDVEIGSAINAIANQLLKTQVLTEQFNFEGESTPQGSLLATYEGLTLTKASKGICKAVLPVMPLTLPDSMGLFQLYPTGRPDLAGDYLFIPMGHYTTYEKLGTFNSLVTTPYTWKGLDVIIYSDLMGAGVFSVDVVLAVMDISTLGDYDTLPLPADLEQAVIDAVIERYAQEKDRSRVKAVLDTK